MLEPSRSVLKQVHLTVIGDDIQHTRVLEFVFTVGAQGDEFGQFEGDEKIFKRLAWPWAFGKITIRLWFAHTVAELINVAQPAAYQRAILPDG